MWTYILTAVLLIAAELIYFKVADHFNIIDKPNERSSHTKITLRGGGVIFYFGVVTYFLMHGFAYPWFFAGLSLIAGISFADDNKPQSRKLRLTIQFLGMALMFHQWGLFDMPWYFTLISLIFCTGILNAYNFMDGINGITGGYSLVVIGTLWYINTYQVQFIDNELLYTIMIALAIFNFFNFRKKAKCFAGDVGALSIAFIIVFLLGQLILTTGDIRYIILLGIYGVDTILTILHRLILRRNIFKPHRGHMFQIMANELKMGHLRVAAIYMLAQLLMTIGFLATSHKCCYFVGIIVVFCIIHILFKMKHFNKYQVSKRLREMAKAAEKKD